MCLAQGHNTLTPVRLEPSAPQSRVKHSTTEPLHSCQWESDNVTIRHQNENQEVSLFPAGIVSTLS